MSFVEAINDQLRTMIIGKKYTSIELAYYDKGLFFPNSIITNIYSSISTVMFPVLSNAQDNLDSMKQMLRRWLSLFAYCVFPILAGLALVAKPFIALLLTEKWLPAVPYLQIACGIYAAWIIEIPIRESIKSTGRADVCLKMQIIKTLFALSVLIVVMNFGVLAIAYTSLVCSFFNISVSVFCGSKYARYKLSELFRDIGPTIFISIFMAVCVYAISLIPLSNFLKLLAQIAVGSAVYLTVSKLSKNSNYCYCCSLIRGIIKVKKYGNA